MGFLDKLKQDKGSAIHADWKILDSEEQLRRIIEDSKKRTVGIFKHSTRCGISTRAKFVLEEDWTLTAEDLDFYYLDLLRYRSVSDLVEELTGVQHQSPQVILLKNGDPVYEETHHAINAGELKEYV